MLPLCSCPLWVNAATHPWKISLATNPDHLPDPSSDRTELRATLGLAGFDVTYGAVAVGNWEATGVNATEYERLTLDIGNKNKRMH